MDQGDDVARVGGAVADDGEEDDGEWSGDELLDGGGEAAAAGRARGLEVEGGVGWG